MPDDKTDDQSIQDATDKTNKALEELDKST
jgi:hypothetical protein